jgi:hypothetical protein
MAFDLLWQQGGMSGQIELSGKIPFNRTFDFQETG